MTTTKRLIVLLSGPIAVGKTSLREKLISDFDFHTIQSSTYLKDLATTRKIDPTRHNLQELGDSLDRESNFRWIVDNVALPLISSNPSYSRWIIDAVRKPEQVEHFRDAFGDSVLHVHLTSTEEILESRYNARKKSENSSDRNIPYNEVTSHPNEQCSRSLITLANIVIDTSKLSPLEAANHICKKLKINTIN
ncbi:AAA family ATPase [Pseudomonas alvandae]|uniref:AAA family ATPase n=1 Tax=Pseudomonas canavaninivorans TaxID=2842348 RepID=UPI003D646883